MKIEAHRMAGVDLQKKREKDEFNPTQEFATK